MNRRIIIKLLAAGCAALCLNSCVKEDIVSNGDVPDGKVELTLYTNNEDYTNPTTRATAQENRLDAPMVLVFKGHTSAATFEEAVQATTVSATSTTTTATVTLTKTTDASTILLIANPPGGNFLSDGNTTPRVFSPVNVTGVMTGKTLADVETLLKTIQLSTPQTTPVFADGTSYLPASGTTQVNKIDETTVLGTSANRLLLTRAVAKAYVTAPAGTSIQGVGAIQAARNGSLHRQSANVQSAANLTNYLTSGGDVLTAVTGTTTTSGTPLYLYETTAAQGTALILKANNRYYKLAFYHNNANQPVERNKVYDFKVTSFGVGYATAAAAIAGDESNNPNIEYTVEVTDGTAHEMKSNELYYLGVSNSQVLIYGQQTNITNAFTITSDAASHGVTNGTITYDRTGGSGTISGTTTFTPSTAGSQINVTIPATVTEGTATITVGNLSLVVGFTRMEVMSYNGQQELDGEYVAGEIEKQGTGNWLSLSTDGTTKVQSVVQTSSPGKLYLAASANIFEENGTTRSGGEAFAVRKYSTGKQERTKIVVDQGFLETGIIGNGDQFAPRTAYVGAFWRNDQTGERLIRIAYQEGAQGTWSATVVDGTDWIILDLERSLNETEGKITWNAATEDPADMNVAANDAKYKVNGNATTVTGRLGKDPDQYIYFRIGLTSTIPDGAPPRYGRVLLDYNNGSKKYFIYIRQGHEPDYVMRNNEPADAGGLGAVRTLAKRFSPYNLTSPEFINKTKTGGNALSGHSQLSPGGGTFTEYPTQAGAYFQWRSGANPCYAYHPSNPQGPQDNPASMITGWSTSSTGGYWSAQGDDNETCPPNYRRPHDGDISALLENPAPLAVNSEIRQSLWLNPHNGAGGQNPSERANSLLGFYADGFFDRREIGLGVGDATGIQVAEHEVSVCSDINDYRIAYNGRLYYNPTTHASLFFPYAGRRFGSTANNGFLQFTGANGTYWTTATATSASYASHMNQQYNYQVLSNALMEYAGMGASPKAHGMTIRCVSVND